MAPSLADATLSTVGNQFPAGTSAWGEKLESVAQKYRPLVDCARAREAAAAATCATLEQLGKQEISMRVWLQTAREEQEAPLLYLAAD